MNDMIETWKTSRSWKHILDEKEIVTEPRTGEQLEINMKKFYTAIEDSKNQRNNQGQTGALFLAVYLGKVSEGIDFADNNARAVICFGIPFLALKDTLVDLKWKYYDTKRMTNPNVLSGQEWYKIKAFRALNQALGRCVRHKNDWGAILMVDDRYSKNSKYVKSLSKWVRGNLVHYSNANQMMDSVQTFLEEMKCLTNNVHTEDKGILEEPYIINPKQEKNGKETNSSTIRPQINCESTEATEESKEEYSEHNEETETSIHPTEYIKLPQHKNKLLNKMCPYCSSGPFPRIKQHILLKCDMAQILM